MRKISDLTDYPAIKKLASALHKFNASQHGAAIMIGAGFSRSASQHVGGVKKMPLWAAFSKKLAKELSPNDHDFSFSDPLRVAEEYRAYFGQAALNDRIRAEIEDEAWRTGPLYQSLLELPWSEVMTTNWDTLLERGAKLVHNPYYTTVTKPADLAWASSPRIVKLHGTIGATDTFVAAQEDYRTYPQRFAPFINFARQVFIENELCLLGFSGDDPNFLQWAGWVRDHLAGHARKIYLVGALNLSAARRRHLESMNISPIDLSAAVDEIDDPDKKHQQATELFLAALRSEGESEEKPHKWKPTSLVRPEVVPDDHARKYRDPAYGASLLKNALTTLQKDRESYPGWLVCPPTLRSQIQHQITDPLPNPENISALEEDDRAKLLYEIAWRRSVTFEYIPPWLAEVLFHVADPDVRASISKRQQLEVALTLLHNSRRFDSNAEQEHVVVQEHVATLIDILEKHSQHLPDAAAELAYYRALVARAALRYEELEDLVGKIAGDDPVWKMRQAALLMELGRHADGADLIAKAYGELRENHRRDRHSLPTLSRLLWAHWLLKASYRSSSSLSSEELPAFAESVYLKWKCDPWKWIEHVQAEIRDRQETYLKGQRSIEPLFKQGYYRSNLTRAKSGQADDFLLLDGLIGVVGIPSAFNANVLSGIAEKIVLTGGTSVLLWDYTLAVRSARSESSISITNVFTRLGVACAKQEVVDILIDRLFVAIKYWRKQRDQGTKEIDGLTPLRVLIEVLARLVVRVSCEKAKEVFRLALSIGQDTDSLHFWLYEALDSLLIHSLNSISESEQGQLLVEALAFPLQSEISASDFPRFPNPVISFLHERNSYPTIEKRIDELIEAVGQKNVISRTSALLRLLPLAKQADFLTITEREKLGTAIWGISPRKNVLPDTELFPHILLIFPTPDAKKTKKYISSYLYDHKDEVLEKTQGDLRRHPAPEIDLAVTIYSGIANAAIHKSARILATPRQALELFDRLVVWRPNIKESHDSQRQRLMGSIGSALSYGIVPRLSADAITHQRFGALQSFFEDIGEGFYVIPALVFFINLGENEAVVVEKIIRKALQGKDVHEVSFAALAVKKWVELSMYTESLRPSRERLITKLISLIESGRMIGLQQVLSVSHDLFKKKLLSEELEETLIDSLLSNFEITQYESIDPHSREAVSVSSIRAECVRLASTIVSVYPNEHLLQELIRQSQTDALPEVRFALNSRDTSY